MTHRLLHISDSHFDAVRRLDDTVRIHEVFNLAHLSWAPDLILHTGDLFHRRSTPEDRMAAAGFLTAAAEIAPVVVIKGNHDQPGDLAIFERLRSAHPITAFERRGGDAFGPFYVIGIPWFDKAHIVSGLDVQADQETTRALTIKAAEEMLLAVGAEVAAARERGQIPIVAGHLMVAGSEIGTGFVPIGTTVEISPHALMETGAEYVALGHVHRAQQWYDGRIAYAGSPDRHDFGEPEEKGFRLVTFEYGRFVSNRFIPLPAREIMLIEQDWTETSGSGATWDPPAPGAFVRFRVRIRPENLAQFDEALVRRSLLDAGAADVKIETVLVHEARVRSAAITTATSTWAKVQAWLDAKGIVLEDGQADRLETKLGAIETAEVARAAA